MENDKWMGYLPTNVYSFGDSGTWKLLGFFPPKEIFKDLQQNPGVWRYPQVVHSISFFPKKFSLVDFTQPYQAHSLHNISLVLLLLIFN